MSDDDRIITSRDGAIGRVTINNPARHNAVSNDMWLAIADAAAAFDADDAVRVITFQGAGEKAFVAGADISRMEADRTRGVAVTRAGGPFATACAAVYEVTKPTVAIIRGWCLGGGMGLAVSCDLRICSDDSRFGIPAAKLSIGYSADGLRRLVDIAGYAAAREIIYTARQYTAAEMLRMGLVNRVLPTAELADFAREYVEGIAAGAPLTLAAAKATLAELARDEHDRDWTRAEALIAQCGTSADHAEGTRAFMEKRRPIFTGR
jgi:enoyl-CoA hydratase/carnithine racemase